MKHYNLMKLVGASALVWGCGGEAGGLSTDGEEAFIPVETSLPDEPADANSAWLVSGLTIEGTRVDFIGVPLEERSSIMMRISGTKTSGNPVEEVRAGSPDVPLTYAELFGGLTDHLVDVPELLSAFHFVQADALGRGYPFIDAVRTALPVVTEVEKARGVFSAAFDNAYNTAIPAFKMKDKRDSSQAWTLEASTQTGQYPVYGCTGYKDTVTPFYAHGGAGFPTATSCPRRVEWVRIGIQNVDWETNNPQAFSVIQWYGPLTGGGIASVSPFNMNPGSWSVFDWADPALKYQAVSAHRGTFSPQTIARFRTNVYVPQ